MMSCSELVAPYIGMFIIILGMCDVNHVSDVNSILGMCDVSDLSSMNDVSGDC